VNDNGRIKWIFNPLSYFGLYAYSAPVGLVYVLSGCSQLTGLNVELSILLTGILISIFAALAAFIMALEFKKGDGFAILVAFVFSTAPFFISGTTWLASGRDWTVALIPFFVWALLRAFKKTRYKYMFIAFLIFITMIMMHRIAWLTVLIVVAFIFATMLHPLMGKLEIFSAIPERRKNRTVVFYAFLISFFIVICMQFLFPGALGTRDIKTEYESSAIVSGSEIHILLLNIGINFIGKISLFAPLAVAGVLFIAYQNRIDITEKFLLLTSIFLLLFISLRNYISVIAMPFFAILISICMFKFASKLKTKNKNACFAIVTVFIITSGSYSWLMKDHWRETSFTYSPIPEHTYNSAVYIIHYTDATFIVDLGYMGNMLSAISNRPSLPLGGASLHTQSHLQALFHNFTLPLEETKINLVDITTISAETDWFYQPEGGVYAYGDWIAIMTTEVDDPDIKNLLNNIRYNITHAVFTAGSGAKFFSYTALVHSEFMDSVRKTRYKIYDNGCETIWYLHKWH
jgi:hypothetical protein